MNTLSKASLICAAVFCIVTASPAQTNSLSPDNTKTNATEFAPGQGIRMDFRDAPLREVLTHMSRAAGFVIYLRQGVQVDGKVNAFSEQPLSKSEAVALLKTLLHDHGYSAIEDDRTLSIVKTEDMPDETPIRIGSDPAKISRGTDIITQIMPVRTVSPVELARVITPFLPSGAIVTASEPNALLLTAPEAGVRRAAEIITALDSVSTSASTLRVLPLHYADAKSLAGLIKELFSMEASSGNSRGSGRGTFMRLPGAGNATGQGEVPLSKVAAVADEHGNAVIVSAPDALIPAIENLVLSVDVPVSDVVEMQVFKLKNADPQEMANVLAELFPEKADSADASDSQPQFAGQRGGGGQAGAARQGNTATSSGPSGRMQKLGRVLAVPDPRTSTLLVSAATSLMPQIKIVINQLDAIDHGRMRAHTYPLLNASPAEVQRILQELFPGGTVTTGGGTQTDPLEARRQTIQNNQTTSGPGSGTGTSTFGSRGSGGRGS